MKCRTDIKKALIKKAIDPKLGSIIGKAMEDHRSTGTGTIYVSVGKH